MQSRSWISFTVAELDVSLRNSLARSRREHGCGTGKNAYEEINNEVLLCRMR